MKKRLLSLALALCLVCSLLPGTALAAGENPFTDVSASHWAHDDITYVYENDLMNGTDGSLFSPESTTTRAQVVTILSRFCQDVIPGGYVSPAHMIRNLEDSTLSKKDTLVAMAEVLLDDGFAPAFVAGILGNIMVEGDCGRFESSAYISNPDAEPDYLVYLDENYDYREKYSYKLIYEGISLQEVYNMILELGPGGANGRGSCFGLGCLQWTSYERIKRLVENYLDVNGNADSITLAQVQEAEGMTVSYELNNTYRSVYTTWQSENADQNTTEAAFAAGVIVCVRYGVPVGYNTEEVQNTRGALAEAVYNVMMGNS